MANTTLTQTGAQVQAILDKADKLPSSLGTAGQVLTMNAGATAPEWQTPSGGGGTLYLYIGDYGANAGEVSLLYLDGTTETLTINENPVIKTFTKPFRLKLRATTDYITAYCVYGDEYAVSNTNENAIGWINSSMQVVSHIFPSGSSGLIGVSVPIFYPNGTVKISLDIPRD